MNSWIDTIRNCTENMITGTMSTDNSNFSNADINSENDETRLSGQLSSDETLAEIQTRKCNRVCVDCSGIHRSLGTHVSKVRSLVLDKWSSPSKALLNACGNHIMNSLLEAEILSQDGWSKPSASAPRKVKKRFIKAKYLWKG